MTELETVWHGAMKHTYFFALRDCPPFAESHPLEELPVPALGKVIDALRGSPHPLDLSQIAGRAHTSGRTTRQCLDQLLSSGVATKVQPTLFDLPCRHTLYRVVGANP